MPPGTIMCTTRVFLVSRDEQFLPNLIESINVLKIPYMKALRRHSTASPRNKHTHGTRTKIRITGIKLMLIVAKL